VKKCIKCQAPVKIDWSCLLDLERVYDCALCNTYTQTTLFGKITFYTTNYPANYYPSVKYFGKCSEYYTLYQGTYLFQIGDMGSCQLNVRWIALQLSPDYLSPLEAEELAKIITTFQ
jgi:hypothetical protein